MTKLNITALSAQYHDTWAKDLLEQIIIRDAEVAQLSEALRQTTAQMNANRNAMEYIDTKLNARVDLLVQQLTSVRAAKVQLKWENRRLREMPRPPEVEGFQWCTAHGGLILPSWNACARNVVGIPCVRHAILVGEVVHP